MPRKRGYRYRRRATPRYRSTYRRSGAELLAEGLVSALVAAVTGLIGLVRRLCTPAPVRAPLRPPPRPLGPPVGKLPPQALVAHARSQPIPPPLPAPVVPPPQLLPVPVLSSAPQTPRDIAPPPGGVTPLVSLLARELPYRRAPRLLSKGERAFWYPLFRAVRGKYRIFCKVRLADVVSAPDSRPDERRWFRKISSFHVDFVICDPKTTAPLLVVELDDRSHASPKRRERDKFKQAVLAAAHVPLYRVPAQEAYDPAELGEKIEQIIRGTNNGKP